MTMQPTGMPYRFCSRPANLSIFRCRGGRTPARHPSAQVTGRYSFAGQLPSCALMDALSITIAPSGSVFSETRKGKESPMSQGRQGKPTPLTAQTIDRLVDLRVALHAIFGADGQVDRVETETLLLLEHAQQTAEQADWARRARNVVEETGELTPTLLRRQREIQRDYQHLQAA